MSKFFLILFALAGILGAGPVRADSDKISALEAEKQHLALVQDSLEVRRARLVQDADSLSTRIDSLKAVDSAELYEALRASLVLEQHLVELHQQREALAAERESLEEDLRLAYDWEIGGLIQRLTQEPDEKLLQQLILYQEAREALGEKFSAARYGEGMEVSLDDGPNEISQKAELMEDIAARLQAEARETTERLHRLEEEQRLWVRVRIFTSELSLFDEHLPEGRVVVRVGSSEGGREKSDDVLLTEDAVLGLAPEFEGGSREPSSPDLAIHREVAREGNLSLEGLGPDDIVLEIRKLKTRQQEIHQLETVARERAQTFRRHLQKLLEGRD